MLFIPLYFTYLFWLLWSPTLPNHRLKITHLTFLLFGGPSELPSCDKHSHPISSYTTNWLCLTCDLNGGELECPNKRHFLNLLSTRKIYTRNTFSNLRNMWTRMKHKHWVTDHPVAAVNIKMSSLEVIFEHLWGC